MADITLKVTSFSPVAIYKLKGQDEQEKCGLCNNNLLDQSVADKEKFDSESKICKGKCGHMFFAGCMKNWLKNHTICPICNTPWEYNYE
jgi:hypothetical protein